MRHVCHGGNSFQASSQGLTFGNMACRCTIVPDWNVIKECLVAGGTEPSRTWIFVRAGNHAFDIHIWARAMSVGLLQPALFI